MKSEWFGCAHQPDQQRLRILNSLFLYFHIMKRGAFIGLLMVFAFASEAQFSVERDSAFSEKEQVFFAKHGIDVSAYPHVNTDLRLYLSVAQDSYRKRNDRLGKAVWAGGISAVFFTLFALHQKNKPLPSYAYPEVPAYWDLVNGFLLALGSTTGAISVGYLISGLETDHKLNKAIDNSRNFLKSE